MIPKQAREIFGIKLGDTLIVLADEKQGFAIPPKSMYVKLASLIFYSDDEERKA